jgi:hypothetical protein
VEYTRVYILRQKRDLMTTNEEDGLFGKHCVTRRRASGSSRNTPAERKCSDGPPLVILPWPDLILAGKSGHFGLVVLAGAGMTFIAYHYAT